MKKMSKIFQTIALFFCSIFIVLYIPFYVAFLTIRSEVKDGIFTNSVDQLNFVYVWENSRDYSDKLDQIVGVLQNHGVPEEVSIALLETTSVKEFLKDRLTKSVDYFCYNKRLVPIQEKDLVILLKNASKEVTNSSRGNLNSNMFSKTEQDLFEHQLPVIASELLEKIPKVEEIIEQKLKEPILKEVPNEVATIENRYNNSLSMIRFFFSYRALVITTEVLVVFILGLLGLNHFRKSSFKWIGFTCVFSTIASILLRTITMKEINEINTPFSLLKAQNYVISAMEKHFILLNFFLLFLGTICLIWYFINLFQAKKQEKRSDLEIFSN